MRPLIGIACASNFEAVPGKTVSSAAMPREDMARLIDRCDAAVITERDIGVNVYIDDHGENYLRGLRKFALSSPYSPT